MKDVQTDERTAFGFDINQACTDQLLQWVYPPLYPVHDPSTPWGKPDERGRCAPRRSLLGAGMMACATLPSHHGLPCSQGMHSPSACGLVLAECCAPACVPVGPLSGVERVVASMSRRFITSLRSGSCKIAWPLPCPAGCEDFSSQ